jgi:psiF repeat
MKKIIALACLSVAVMVSAPAFAGAQQEKMKGCNVEAKGMKGADRKAFMSKCLKKDYTLKAAGATPAADAKPTAAAAPTQQNKMKSCNADAKTKALKGADRKTFMSSCLKGDAAPAAEAKPTASAAAPAAATAAPTQQNKMKSCNADAKTKALKGADRKTFMSACLKG